VTFRTPEATNTALPARARALAWITVLAAANASCSRHSEVTRPPPPGGAAATAAPRTSTSVVSVLPSAASDAVAPGVASSLSNFAAASPGITGSLVPGPTVGSTWVLVELGGVLFATPNAGTVHQAGGVLRSDDGGLTWARMSNGLPLTTKPGVAKQHVSITALIAVDSTLLAGTPDLEIYRSIDAGVTWLPAERQPEKPKFSTTSDWAIRRLAVLPKSIVALTAAGTFVSSDRGNGWLEKDLGFHGGFGENLRAFDGVLYATTDDGLRVSYDEGETFSLEKLPHAPDDLIARNGVVYVSFQESGLPVYASRDRGRTWRPTTQPPGPWSHFPLALYGLTLSPPTGVEADQSTSKLYSSLTAVDLGKRGIAVGTPWGPWVSTDRGATAREAEAGFTASAIVHVAVGDSRLFAAFHEDRVGLAWSERSRPSWSYVKGLGSVVTALVANGAEIFVGDDWGKLVQSLDEGRTFAECGLPTTPQGPVQAIAVWKDRRLVVRGAILFSTDAGRTWKDLSSRVPLEAEVLPGSRATSETTRYPLTSAVVTEQSVLLGAASGVLRGAPGRAWSVAPLPAPVVALAHDAGAVYAVTATTLFESRNDGRSFRAIAGGLGSSSGLAITNLGAARGELLVIAKSIAPRTEDSFRALHSHDGGKTWRLVSQKMEYGPTSAPVAGPGGWYLGLASDGLWFLPTAVSQLP